VRETYGSISMGRVGHPSSSHPKLLFFKKNNNNNKLLFFKIF